MATKRGLQGKPNKRAAGEAHALAEKEGQDRSAWLVPVNRVEPDPGQPRRTFDDAALKSLATDLNRRGIRQPLVVSRHGDKYRIVAGERRYRAALEAGLDTVPVRLIEPEDVLEEQLIENLQREDLNPVDEADAIHVFRSERDLSVRETAERLGLSKSSVDRKLKIVDMTDSVRDKLRAGEISYHEAEQLSKRTSGKEKRRSFAPFVFKERRDGGFDATIKFRPDRGETNDIIAQLEELVERLKKSD